MKRTISVLLMMVLVMVSSNSEYANQRDMKQNEINDAATLGKIISEKAERGYLSKIEKETILSQTSPTVVQEFVNKKVEDAERVLEKVDKEVVFDVTNGGKSFAREEYDIGDGCMLILEFEEGSEPTNDTFINQSQTKAATTNPDEWKAYGNRYFTAKKLMVYGIGTLYLCLENHYTLSENGIDERFGDAYAAGGSNITETDVEVLGVYITDDRARTVGESDVNMYARFRTSYKIENLASVFRTRKLSTTVGYVEHDFVNKKIKVRHSWDFE